MTDDRVERTIHIAATTERVWDILTKPEHIGRWFGSGTPATVDLRPDGVMVLEPMPGERYLARVVKVDPPHYLAYRWASAYPNVLADETNSTLVEFQLAAEGTTTRLTVCESGFATLTIPAGREPFASYGSHSRGWTEVIRNIADLVEQRAS
ncbi:MAG: SRPBCC family protein [Jatrophihabitantaceae bacterium]